MRRFFIAICVCLTLLTIASSAFAEELWDAQLRVANEGLASGVLPPAGLYFINDLWWSGDWKAYDNAGGAINNIKLGVFVDVPILLWNPGLNPILGATYACAIAQPFDGATLRVGTSANAASPGFSGTQWGAFNTLLVPFILSWNIPCHFHVAASMVIALNNGTNSTGDSLASITHNYADRLLSKDAKAVYAWSSTEGYMFAPDLGISWLYGGWNISAEFNYAFFTKDNATDYQNGPQFSGTYTATYTSGRWTFGIGAFTQYQTSNDTGNNGIAYREIPDTCNVNVEAGPILGYNFGPCSLMFVYNFPITIKDDVGGEVAVLRLVVPLGNPYNWYK